MFVARRLGAFFLVLAAVAVAFPGAPHLSGISLRVSIRGMEGQDNSASGVGTIKATGFNTVLVAADRARLDALRALGMRAVVWLGGYSTRTCGFDTSDIQVKKSVAPIANHPAVVAYFLADQPDQARTRGCARVAEQLRARSALVRSIAPKKRTYVTISAWDGIEAFPYRHFSRSADILGLVVYPYSVGHSEPGDIDRAIAAAERAGVTHYWAIVQDFGDDFYRQPNATELREQFRRWKRSSMDGYFVRDWKAGNLSSKPAHLSAYAEVNGVVAPTWRSTPKATPSGTTGSMTPTRLGDGIPPIAPTNLQLRRDQGRVELTWTASTDNQRISHYRVIRDGVLDDITTATTFLDFPRPGKTHLYQVIAVDTSGNLSLPVTASITLPSRSSPYVGWDVFCTYSHSLKDDPIVKPAQIGASHLHDFFGNKSTDAFSTMSSMSGGGTTCALPDERAGYWVPALYADGRQILPGVGRSPMNGEYAKIKVRHFSTTHNDTGISFTSPPPDLRVVVGVSTATTPAANPLLGDTMWWGCSSSEDQTDRTKSTQPVHCKSGIVSLHIKFPDCWDGVHTDTVDHKSHLAYVDEEKACPASHPKRLPPTALDIEYHVGTAWQTITLASGGSSSVHADLWNTWNQPMLNRMVRDCFNARVWCGIFYR